MAGPRWRDIADEVFPWDVEALFVEMDPFRSGRTTRVGDVPSGLARLYSGRLSSRQVQALGRSWVLREWPGLRDAKVSAQLYAALGRLGDLLREAENRAYDRQVVEQEDARQRVTDRLARRVSSRRERAARTDPGPVSTRAAGRRWAQGGALPRVLYHATMHGRAIMREGLRARVSTAKQTLGGGPDHLVSLTEDREGAFKIAAALAAINEAHNDPVGVCAWFRQHWLPWVRVRASWSKIEENVADSPKKVKRYFDAMGSVAAGDPTMAWASIPWIMGTPARVPVEDIGVIVAYANVDQLQGPNEELTRGLVGGVRSRGKGVRPIVCPEVRGGARTHATAGASQGLRHAAFAEDTGNAAEKYEVRVCPSDLTVVAFERAPNWRAVLLPPGVPGSSNRRTSMPPSRDVSRTQLDRCALSVYERLVSKGADPDDRETVSRAFAICTKSLQRNQYLVEGTNTPTLKGHRRSREKAADVEDAEKYERYQAMLARVRKKPDSSASKKPLLSDLLASLQPRAMRGAANALPLPMGSANRSSDLRSSLLPLRDALDDVFACTTAFGDCKRERPSAGHCMLASMVVQDLFGGEIVSGEVKGIPHYWNRVKGVDVDLTGDQFGYAPVRIRKGALYRGGRVFPRQRGRALQMPWNSEVMTKYQSFVRKLVPRMRKKGQSVWGEALVRTQAASKDLRVAA